MKPEPIVFVSYSHDGEEHSAWVLQLATRLRRNGVDVILDRWECGARPRPRNIYGKGSDQIPSRSMYLLAGICC